MKVRVQTLPVSFVRSQLLEIAEGLHISRSLFNDGKEVVECLIVSRRSRQA